MEVSERKEGYGNLINWIIHFGDLFLINGFILLSCYFSLEDGIKGGSIDSESNIISILLINLVYFITIFFIPIKLSFNVLHIDKVIQNSVYFILLYSILLTLALLLFNEIPIDITQWIFLLFLLSILYIFWHVFFRLLLKAYRRRGYNYKTIVILGAGENSVALYNELRGSDYGYKIIGYYDDELDEKNSENLPPYLGTVADFIKGQKKKVDQIYCTLYNKDDEIKALINFSERNMIRFYIVPNFYRYTKRKLSLAFVEAIPILSIRREPLQYLSNRIIKRSFDVTFSLLILLTIFPFIYIIFGAIIKLTSPGKIFFKQERTGIKGKEFYCYKFRSMKNNKDANLKSATKEDPRVTKVGAFMRKTNIDELPQFINVLKGDMSIVGPRPHMLRHTDMYSSLINQFMVRHLVKPGITGWAQVRGLRGEIETIEDMEKRVQKDVWYIENWSFFLDLKVIFLTVFNMFKGEDKAY